MNIRALVVQVMAMIGAAGPWVFFGAMTVLPAFGFPLLGFAIPAGPAFGGQLGAGGVLAAYGAALAINLTLTYWMARYQVRPLAERLLVRAGYKIPQFDPSEENISRWRCWCGSRRGLPIWCNVICWGSAMWRSSPICGCHRVIMMLYAVGIVVFGDAIIHGRSGMAAMGVHLLVAAGIIVHLARRHYGKRRVQSGS